MNKKEKILGKWEPLYKEFDKDYMKKIFSFLSERRSRVLPEPKNVFRAFKLTPLTEVKVVFIAQDPYPDPRHAEGLAFHSPSSLTPDSLKNIKKLLENTGFTVSSNNSLIPWTAKGVLLLNTHLTTEKGVSGAHQHIGWDRFTAKAIETIETLDDNKVVYALTGKHAHEYSDMIINPNHTYILTSHPTSRACWKSGKNYTAFMMSDLFNHINEYLNEEINFGI